MIENRRQNGILIGLLVVMIIIMSVGFANLSTQLTFTSTATATGTWDVQISSVVQTYIAEGCNVTKTEINNNTLSLGVELEKPGDSVVFDVTVKNNGTISAMLEQIDLPIEDNNNLLTYKIVQKIGSHSEELKSKLSHVFTITIAYKDVGSITESPAPQEFTTKFNYTQFGNNQNK